MAEPAPDLDLRLYFITPAEPPPGGELALVSQAAAGGATAVQLRAKNVPDRRFWERAVLLRRLTWRLGLPLIVNDRVDLALAVGADGCHVGDWDLPPTVARNLLGPGRILGVSAETPHRLREAVKAGADYAGVGPIYGTGTKADAGEARGTAWLADMCARTSLPVVAIGGIGPGRAAPVLAAGARGVAVVAAIAGAANPREAAARLRREVDAALGDGG